MATLVQIDLMQEGVLFGLPMPLTFRPPVAMSDLELMAFSRRNRPYQIERNAEGELEIKTPVGMDGARWEAFAAGELYLWAREHGGVVFSSNGGVTLADGSMRSPDAAWLSDERWNALGPEEQARYSPICSEFLIEVLSINASRPRLEAKMQMWRDNGARLAWMIDPYAQRVSVYRAQSEVEVFARPDFVEAGEPVTGFRLNLAAMWERSLTL